MINAHLISPPHGNTGLEKISSLIQRKLTFKAIFEELFEILHEQMNKANQDFSPANFQSFHCQIAHNIFSDLGVKCISKANLVIKG